MSDSSGGGLVRSVLRVWRVPTTKQKNTHKFEDQKKKKCTKQFQSFITRNMKKKMVVRVIENKEEE